MTGQDRGLSKLESGLRRDADAALREFGGPHALIEGAQLARKHLEEAAAWFGGAEALSRWLAAGAKEAAAVHLASRYDRSITGQHAFLDEFAATVALFDGSQAGSKIALERADLAARAELPSGVPKPALESYDPANRAAVQGYETGLINELEIEFSETQNPVAPWEALRRCLAAEHAIPRWVLSYLAACAANISKIGQEVQRGKRTGREAERVGRSLGFAPTPGAGSWVTKRMSMRRDREIYRAVREEVSKGDKLSFAQENVARKLGTSTPTVRRAYGRVALLVSGQEPGVAAVTNGSIPDGHKPA